MNEPEKLPTPARKNGRRRKLTPAKEKRLIADYLKGELTFPQMEKKYGVGRQTIYNTLERNSVPVANPQGRAA